MELKEETTSTYRLLRRDFHPRVFKILVFYIFENVPFLSHLTVNFDASLNKKPIAVLFHQQAVEKLFQNAGQNPRRAITAARSQRILFESRQKTYCHLNPSPDTLSCVRQCLVIASTFRMQTLFTFMRSK